MILFAALPIWYSFGLFVQPDIALMAGRLDFTVSQGLQNRAALFFYMGTIHELTFVQIRSKFREAALEMFFTHQFHLIHIKGRETRGIRNQSISQSVEFYVSGRMLSAA